MQPKQEYGYVIIDTEEKRKVFSPKVKTDQIWREAWAGNLTPDDKFWDNEIYRRKIQPGDGLEIVPFDEKETWSMEYTSDGINWLTNVVWPSEQIANKFPGVLAFRRPIKHPATPPVESTPWRPIGDLTGLPNEDDTPVLIAYGVAAEFRAYVVSAYSLRHRKFHYDRYYTHWQPIAPVPRPPKPMTESEALAYAKLCHAAYDAERVEEGWNARKAFEKGGAK